MEVSRPQGQAGQVKALRRQIIALWQCCKIEFRAWLGQDRSFDMRQGYLHSGIAVLFLTLMVADLMCVWSCCTEVAGIPAARSLAQTSRAAIGTIHTERASVDTDRSRQEHHSEQSRADDGCFCCAHVLPGISLAEVVSMVEPEKAIPLHVALPSSPPQRLFHPPRCA
jgi:hypothetical protein